jgi:RNAse (barnase) inhibitor barstar
MTATFDSVLSGAVSPGVYCWRGRRDRDLVGEATAAGWQAMSLDTRSATSFDDFYDAVAMAWNLPEWFGRNLDALFDVLADVTTRPTLIVWDGLRELADVDPVQAGAVVEVLRDATGQASTLVVIVRDELEISEFDGLL